MEAATPEFGKGLRQLSGPRSVLRQAFSDGLIQDGENWLKMLVSRNLTVHSYNEATAQEIADLVKTIYYPLITKLLEQLREEKEIWSRNST